MRVLRAADRRASPWKNGGGVTWEVAISPDGAALDAFDWRLSIAEVASSGPFSSFPGIDRVLTVIEGEGLRLRVEGADPVTLGQSSPPLAFAGDAACIADLTAARIRDFNVMVRRAAHRAAVRRVTGPIEITNTGGVLGALALDATEVNGRPLHPEDFALADVGERLELGDGAFVVVELSRA